MRPSLAALLRASPQRRAVLVAIHSLTVVSHGRCRPVALAEAARLVVDVRGDMSADRVSARVSDLVSSGLVRRASLKGGVAVQLTQAGRAEAREWCRVTTALEEALSA